MASAMMRKRFSLSTQDGFGFAIACALPEEREDQQGLKRNDGDGSDNVFSILLPDRRGPVQDYGVRRECRFRNMPVLKRTPVHSNPKAAVMHDGNVLRTLTGQHSRGDLRGLRISRRIVTVGSANASMVQTERVPRRISWPALGDRIKKLPAPELRPAGIGREFE